MSHKKLEIMLIYYPVVYYTLIGKIDVCKSFLKNTFSLPPTTIWKEQISYHYLAESNCKRDWWSGECFDKSLLVFLSVQSEDETLLTGVNNSAKHEIKVNCLLMSNTILPAWLEIQSLSDVSDPYNLSHPPPV